MRSHLLLVSISLSLIVSFEAVKSQSKIGEKLQNHFSTDETTQPISAEILQNTHRSDKQFENFNEGKTPDDTAGDSEDTTPDVEAEAERQKAIDVSNWQGTINWSRVAQAGVKHAFIKMSEGGNFVDKKFVENWNGAAKAGLKVNCYHYFRAHSGTPKQQFDNIKRNTEAVRFDPAKNSLAIDVEATGNENATPEQMADNLNALLELIKKDSVLSRRPTLIYTSVGYWDSKVKYDKYNFAAYPLWVARWGVPTPKLPASWRNANKSWTWWQYSATGKVNGIDGDVDLDWAKV